MPNVTKKDLIDRVVARTREKRVVVKNVVQTLFDLIIEELARGNRIELRDFGVFEVKQHKARTAQNPKTLAKVEVPEKASVKFKAGRLMKDNVDRRGDDGCTGDSNGSPVPRDGRPSGGSSSNGAEVPVVETTGPRITSRK